MPVGTLGTVKGVHQRELNEDIRAQIILANTYHLYLRPGTDLLKAAGGLHAFMNWSKPILTDSGGYQVFSLSGMRKITREGVWFSSHIDGSKHFFSPEKVMEIQRAIGADIMMAFDECPPYPCDAAYAERSLGITMNWLQQCMQYLQENEPLYGFEQLFFPIVQGGVFRDLRARAAAELSAFDVPGIAIGGLSVGEPADLMYEISELVCSILPEHKPRYLMGVGTPVNILENIALGVDLFDCVMPARNGRNGMLFTSEGIINIKNEKWKNDFSAIDEHAHTYVDTAYSKAYLRHLFAAGERLGPQIASIHNLGFYLWLVKEARTHIINDTFVPWKTGMIEKLGRRL